jgi:hypothetical protein
MCNCSDSEHKHGGTFDRLQLSKTYQIPTWARHIQTAAATAVCSNARCELRIWALEPRSLSEHILSDRKDYHANFC